MPHLRIARGVRVRKLNRRFLAIAGVLALGSPTSAQWLRYPTPGVPRLADGKPNLTAPAPRTADGKPDLSGIWRLEARCASEGCTDYAGAPEFRDFGAKLE